MFTDLDLENGYIRTKCSVVKTSHICYRPQTKFAKVMFLNMSVCPQVGVVSQHALQVVSQHALQVSRGVCVSQHALQVSRLARGSLRGLARGVSRPTPRGVSRPTPRGVSRPTPGGSPGPHPGGGGGVSQHALRQTPLADGYCCGRYASYWNTFLFN